MPNYDSNYFNPPAPLAFVTLRDSTTGNVITDVPMLLDTGADATLLPESYVSKLKILPIQGLFFEIVDANNKSTLSQVVRLEMIFEGKTFRGDFLLIEQAWGIIGRNILNSLPFIFNGPKLLWNIQS
jgi:predicted aspartyl protease